MNTKLCPHCGIEKSTSDFHNNKSSKDGKAAQCKPCKIKLGKKSYEKHKESISARQKEWRVLNEDRIKERLKQNYLNNKEMLLAKNAAYREKNREKIRAQQKTKREENKELFKLKDAEKYAKRRDAVLETAKLYRKNNAEKIRVLNANRRALMRRSEGRYSKSDVDKLLSLQKCKCASCGTGLGSCYHVDHIVPLARGGSNWPSNLQILCAPCNLSKSAKDPIEWAQANGRLL